MRYIMKQKVFSFGDKFAIRNEDGEDAFFANGAMLSLGHKLSFEDPQGNELLFISQKLLSWGPTYELYRGDEHIATIKKEMFTFFKCTFDIHIADKGALEAQGDFSDHEYTVTRAGEPMAQISKQWFTWSDTYGVDIAPGEDPVLILASTVVIDMCCHEQSQRSPIPVLWLSTKITSRTAEPLLLAAASSSSKKAILDRRRMRFALSPLFLL